MAKQKSIPFRDAYTHEALIREYLPPGGHQSKISSPGKNIKHLMTGPKGNSEFCFLETLNVPRGEAEGNIEVEGKQNSLFPEGPVIKCFVIPCNSNIGKKTAKI